MNSKPMADGLPGPQRPANNAQRSYLSLTVLLIGLILSLLVYQVADNLSEQRITEEFIHEANSHTAEVLENIHNYHHVITALKVLYHYSRDVTHDEFRGAALELGSIYPGIQALEWVPAVPGDQRHQFEAKAQTEGFENFRIIERQANGEFRIAQQNDEYWPILYAEPYEPNAAIIGYNLLSAPTVEILKLARDYGDTRATQAFQLAQETEGELGWIIIEPVYTSKFLPDNLVERQQTFRGFIQGVIRLPDMLNATWSDQNASRLDIMITDITADPEQLIYFNPTPSSSLGTGDSNPREAMLAASPHHFIDSEILGRQWRFYFHPGKAWLQSHNSLTPYFILSSSVALTLLITGMVHFQLRRTEIVQGQVMDRTEALTMSNDRLQLAMQSAKMCAWEWDILSDAFTTISIDPDSRCRFIYQVPTRRQFLENVHPEDRGMLQDIGVTISNGDITAYNREFRIPAFKDSVHWVAESGMAVQDKSGNTSKIIGVARDVTAEKQTEREKNDALILLDTLLRSAPVGMSLLDTDYRYVRINDTNCDFLGRERSELIGKPVIEFLGPLGDTIMPLLNQVLQTGQPIVNYELQGSLPGAGGVIKHWLANYYPVLSSEGKLQGIGTVLIDITEKRQAEEEIRKSSERFELLAKATNDFVWDWDLKTQTVWRNAQYAEYLPHIDSSVADIDVMRSLVHPDDRERVVNSVAAAIEGSNNEWSNNFRIVKPSGEITYVFNRGYIVRDDQGNGIRMIGAMTDVTAQKEFEDRINQLNAELERRVEIRTSELRMALDELESFSYTVSHDLRAPLRTVNGFASIMREDMNQLSEENRHYLARICTASEHMDQLITDLLRLARISRQDMEIEEVDISAMAKSIVADMQVDFFPHQPEVKIQDGLTAYCDSGLIRILLTNLFSNAFKFTQKVDSPRIELGSSSKRKKRISGFYLKDNGAGFDMQYSKQLFSPFRRLHTSSEFEGTGIGLATVRRIARRHGGDIQAESAIGQGSTFTFWFQI